jgi:multidrug efflux pump
MTSLAALFVKRPVGASLVAAGIFLSGALAFFSLPVSSLPSVDLPTLRVSATRPGADPDTMARTVAAPLERQIGALSGVTEITSTSSLGSTVIAVQFDLGRSVDKAARDVQAAINAAANDLPTDLQTLPLVRKLNPAAFPILVLALTSSTLPNSTLYDIADSVIAQRIAQVPGVGDVSVSGADQPAIRVTLDPQRLNATGVSLDAVRAAIAAANVLGPLGSLETEDQTLILKANAQLQEPDDYRGIVIGQRNGSVVRLGDIADIRKGVRNERAAGWFNGKPAIILQVTKQPNANVIDTVDAVNALLPELTPWIPADAHLETLTDRTESIRASIRDLFKTLAAAVILVMLVVLVFLRDSAQTLAVGITVPLSVAGCFACMWAVGFSVDTLSLMAITISVGFVVDDSIVIVENVHRLLESGETPMMAAIKGARELFFTVISISVSLAAAFIPLIFMDGVIGRLFREFSLTLVFAITVSTFVSLAITPMICSKLLRAKTGPSPWRFVRGLDHALATVQRLYQSSLTSVVMHPWLTLVTFIAVIAATVHLFSTLPKGFFPQDDIGLIFGSTEASPDISYAGMKELQQKVAAIVQKDPSVNGVASFIGAQGGLSTVNQGRLLVSLKPYAERKTSSAEIVARLRLATANIPGIRLYMASAQDMRSGARSGKSPMQFTLWGQDVKLIQEWAPKVEEALKKRPEFADVSTDKVSGGLQAQLTFNRDDLGRYGVSFDSVDAVLNNAFGQRQIATFYGPRNQYRTILTVGDHWQSDISQILALDVPTNSGALVPLGSVAEVTTQLAPLAINHQGQFASITITYDMALGVTQDAATQALRSAVADLHMPEDINADFAGDAKAFVTSSNSQGVLILAALFAVYLILGILYESTIHPLTILSTLPSATLGALIALKLFGMEINLIALIGIILLIGLVKKNGIILLDFAQTMRRSQALSARDAIIAACGIRFRPILMTTMAALLGALPLLLATGPGAELRRPLGVTIIGGLMLSQLLTLYTTPVIYLLLDRFTRRRSKPETLNEALKKPEPEQAPA